MDSCQNCYRVFTELRILPCGESVCEKCIAAIAPNDANQFSCSMCSQVHDYSSTFPLNKFVMNARLIFNRSVDDRASLLKARLHKGQSLISSYCEQLREEIRLVTEFKVNQLNQQCQEYLDLVDQFEAESLANFLTYKSDVEERLATDNDIKSILSQISLDMIFCNKRQLKFESNKEFCSLGDLYFNDHVKSELKLDFGSMKQLDLSFVGHDSQNSISLLALSDERFSLCYLDKDSLFKCFILSIELEVISYSQELFHQSKIDYFKQAVSRDMLIIYTHKLENNFKDEIVLVEPSTFNVIYRFETDSYLNQLTANSSSLYCLNFDHDIIVYDVSSSPMMQSSRLDIDHVPQVVIQMECNELNLLFFMYSDHLNKFNIRIVNAQNGCLLRDLAIAGDQMRILTSELFLVYSEFDSKLCLFSIYASCGRSLLLTQEEYDVVDRESMAKSSLRMVNGKSRNIIFFNKNHLLVYY